MSRQSIIRRSLTLAIISTGSLLISTPGCAIPPKHEQLAAFVKSHEHLTAGTEQRIAPGDTIVIEAPRIHEFNGISPQIQPDGKISLRLIGEVKVAGLTPREVASKLEQLVSPYYRDPTVHVRVSQKVRDVYYVFGEVGGEGMYRFTGRDSVLDALARARPTFLAWKQRVKIIRPSPFDDQVREFEIDIDKMVREGDIKLNVLLEPGDVVYVPPTPLAWVGLRFRELLYPVSPVLSTYRTPADFMYTQDEYENPDSAGRRR